MSKGILLSPKQGVNPSMGVCWYCGEDDGTIILPGRLPGDAEAPRRAVWTMQPCDKCKGLMAQGVMVFEAHAAADAAEHVRTGRMWLLKDDAICRLMDAETAQNAIRNRAAFIDPEAATRLGLPR